VSPHSSSVTSLLYPPHTIHQTYYQLISMCCSNTCVACAAATHQSCSMCCSSTSIIHIVYRVTAAHFVTSINKTHLNVYLVLTLHNSMCVLYGTTMSYEHCTIQCVSCILMTLKCVMTLECELAALPSISLLCHPLHCSTIHFTQAPLSSFTQPPLFYMSHLLYFPANSRANAHFCMMIHIQLCSMCCSDCVACVAAIV